MYHNDTILAELELFFLVCVVEIWTFYWFIGGNIVGSVEKKYNDCIRLNINCYT